MIYFHSACNYFNSSKVRLEREFDRFFVVNGSISIPVRYDWNAITKSRFPACTNFNSSKVRLERISGSSSRNSENYFNSSKVRLELPEVAGCDCGVTLFQFQ